MLVIKNPTSCGQLLRMLDEQVANEVPKVEGWSMSSHPRNLATRAARRRNQQPKQKIWEAR